MKNFIAIIFISIILVSCSKDETKESIIPEKGATENKVLMLKVDYITNTFEGGKEFIFNQNTTTFNTNVVVQSNDADRGSIKVTYQELNEKLFEGSQNWTGKIVFPTDFLQANTFPISLTQEVNPLPIMQNIYNPENQNFNYSNVINSFDDLVIYKNYRISNPSATVKIFLFSEYNNGVAGAPRNKWIIILKN